MSILPTSRNKDTYKVRNRKANHSILCQRGSLRLYLEDERIERMGAMQPKKSK